MWSCIYFSSEVGGDSTDYSCSRSRDLTQSFKNISVVKTEEQEDENAKGKRETFATRGLFTLTQL